MRDKAMITSVDNNKIMVIPLISDACISCAQGQGCSKQGSPFEVVNPNNFKLYKGLTVKIGESKGTKSIQGIIALFFPILSAITGYLLSNKIALAAKSNATEGFKATCVLLFLAASCFIVYFISRTVFRFQKSEIVQTFEN